MGLDAATEALRWGVNDLGGTLMEESISRMAGSYHGVRLDPDDLIGAAHRAGRPAAERTTLYDIRRRYELGGRRVTELDPRARCCGYAGHDGGARSGSRPTRPCRSRSLEAASARADVRVEGHHYALVHVDGARARARRRPTRSRSTASRCGREPDSRVPAERHPHPRRRDDADADRVRLLPRRRAARAAAHAAQGRAPATAARSTRCAALALRMARAATRGVAARAAAARRPGLRRRGLARRARVHPLAPRPRGAAGRDGRRLRGVHAALPRVVGRAVDPLAALDRAQRDDLRRPRRPRRLEHVDRRGSTEMRATGLVATSGSSAAS